jgi:lysine-N-methylase
MQPARVLRPGYFAAFRCIGSACEDTCCIGWNVAVDHSTYDKYRACSDAELGPSLHRLIVINEQSTNDEDYAKITLTGAVCPFLADGLCSIQKGLGEEYLSNKCATYPRVMNRVGDALHQSLLLSCPEAARMVLLDPSPIEFADEAYEEGSVRPGNYPALENSRVTEFRKIRPAVISLLQDRSHPVWKRLLMVGDACSLGPSPAAESRVDPASQLESVLDLIVARISSDFNPRGFLECYAEFMKGLEWTSKSTREDIGARYAEACAAYYLPFISRHEHVLEHYLVNYAHRTLFPFGLPESNQRLRHDQVPSEIAAQYMLMVANFAVTQTLLIGMAGFHKEAFDVNHAIKLIQSCAKTFDHSVTFPGRAIAMLADKGMTTPATLGALIQVTGS